MGPRWRVPKCMTPGGRRLVSSSPGLLYRLQHTIRTSFTDVVNTVFHYPRLAECHISSSLPWAEPPRLHGRVTPSGMDCRSVPGRLEWMGSGGVISANDSSVKNWKEKEAFLPRGGD